MGYLRARNASGDTGKARVPQRGARFYAPRKEFFDKAWKLPDVEKIAAR
jgi:hypothetical protein